jgi:hypothetical protein
LAVSFGMKLIAMTWQLHTYLGTATLAQYLIPTETRACVPSRPQDDNKNWRHNAGSLGKPPA